MRRFYTFLYLLLFACFATTASGQDLEIAGKVVTKAKNEALPGAIIKVKATTRGTTTSVNGEFMLTLPGRTEATLVVSYVGYKTVETQVTGSRRDLLISLDEDILKLSEVVATGFVSSVKRQNLANSVATVNEDEIAPAPAQTLDQALAGKFAGINVSQNTGAPGGGISITLRGVSTIEGATQPLYVVDGVIYNNSANQSGIDLVSKATGAGSDNPQGQPVNRIADLNPNEIQSIEVFKGASAAALYGSKATNGVVIITTKQGVPGTTRIDFSQRIGLNSLLRKIDTRRFTAATALAHFDSAGLAIFNAGGGRFIDYEDEMYGENGFINESDLSIRGGSDKTQFYVSGLLRDEDGIIKNTGYKKYSGRVNVNHKLADDLGINVMGNFTRSESDRGITGNDNTNTTFGFSLGFTPSFYDIRPVNGVYPDHIYNPSNPLHTRDVLRNNEVVHRTLGSLTLDWNIVTKEAHRLDFIARAGVDYYSQENEIYSPQELQFEKNSSLPGAFLRGLTESTNSNLHLNLSHTYITSSDISFKTSGGTQLESQNVNNVLNEARGLVVNQATLDQASTLTGYHTIIKQRELGFYIQEEVNIQERIYLTAGVRGDASSVNGDPDKFYFFPKFSGSIRLSQYEFWRGLSNTFNEFKLRAAYGETGNLAPPVAKFTSLEPANIGGQSGLLPEERRGDPTIKPERTKELEVGLDAALFDGNASLEFSYFVKNISDLLLIPTLAQSSGFTDAYINGGEMRTDGFEVSLGVIPFSGDDFTWSSRVNFYKTQSEITQLDIDPFNKGGFATFLGTYRIEEGLSPTTIIGSETDASGKNIPLGDETPDFQISFNNRFTVGAFEFGFLLDWKQGGDIINLGKLITDLGATTGDYDELGQFNIGTADGTGDSIVTMKNGDGRLTVLGSQTAPYIEDGTYLKLREATITYNVPQSFVKNLFGGTFTYLRLGLSGRNLLVFTGYDGYDPEVSQFGNVAIGRSVDTLPYPSTRSYYFSVSFGL